MDTSTIDEILGVAIRREETSARLYRDLAEKGATEELRRLLLSLAAEEEEHRDALERARAGDLSVFTAPPSDEAWLIAPSAPVELGASSSLAQALLAAIDRERSSSLFYADLADRADDPGIRTLFASLAGEEVRHWQSLQRQYEVLVAG